ncbi:MAG: hypothetical protein VXY28_07465 [Bacteroidota bacterium]|nr:hypothetical protein [Bacteroidota bacterium]
MLRYSLFGLLFFVFSCKDNYKDNLIFINENFPVEFFQIADCNSLDTNTFLNLNIVAKSKSQKIIFSSEFQGLESISTFYYDSLMNSNLSMLFENLCVGDSVFFKLKLVDFYSGFFKKDSSLQAKPELDSLLVNMKVISSNDMITQNQLENQLIKRAKEREEFSIQKLIDEWENKFLNLFYYDNLVAVKVGQYSADRVENLDSLNQFIALSYSITDLNDRLIYQTSTNSLEYYDKSLNDQLLEGFRILVNEFSVGDSLVAIMPSKMAFGKRGSFTNKIPPYTPLKVNLKIVQK